MTNSWANLIFVDMKHLQIIHFLTVEADINAFLIS